MRSFKVAFANANQHYNCQPTIQSYASKFLKSTRLENIFSECVASVALNQLLGRSTQSAGGT
jgi:phage head maturation protease